MKKQPRAINEIAREIKADWKNVYFGAVPYLQAMLTLTSVNEKYGMDSADDIIGRFLANAQYWRGAKAKEIKAELNSMIK